MNIEHLKYLVTVADSGSIHGAARKLLLKQQYLSSVIKTLEQTFDVKIFERFSRGVTLTTNGAYLVDKARAILALYQEMEMGFLYPDNEQLLEFSDPICLYLPAVIDGERLLEAIDVFNSYFPNVHIVMSPFLSSDNWNFLLNDKRGILVLLSSETVEAVKKNLGEELELSVLKPFSLVLATALSNERAKQYRNSAISIKDALNLELLILASDLRESAIFQTIRSYGEPNVKFIMDNPMLAIRALEQKDCFMFMSELQMRNNDRVIGIPLKEDIVCNLFLVYHKEALTQFDTKSLITLIQRRCSM